MASRVTQQSIRSSCDRCRFQKLKCTVLTDGEKCERCARAKVDCVFSRRAKTRRPSDTQSVTDKRKNVSDPHRMNLGSISPLILDSLSDCRVNDYPLLDSQVRYRGTWDSSPFGGHGSDIAIDGIANNMIYDREALREYQPDHGRLGPDLFNFTVPSTFSERQTAQNLTPFGQDDGSLPYSQIRTTHGGDTGRDSPPTAAENGRSHVIPRLSALVAEIYETCGMLRDGPWAGMNNAAAMNDYPIGRILHLSQEFTSILQKTAWTTGMISSSESDPTSLPDCIEPHASSSYCYMYGLATPISAGAVIGQSAGILEAGLQDRVTSASESSQSSVGYGGLIDAPVMLLVLSCFISLTKLYGIAFTHFETHLCGLPPASLTSADIGLTRSRGLQLGELPLLDETYSKTYTGVRMLLDTFQSAEDVIGLPNSLSIIRGSTQPCTEGVLSAPRNELKGASPWTAFQGELALAVLKQDALIGGSSFQESFHDLSMKIHSLKRMLREKMDL